MSQQTKQAYQMKKEQLAAQAAQDEQQAAILGLLTETAKDLYVAGRGTPNECIDMAREFVKALQSWKPPAPVLPAAPVDANGTPVAE